MPNHSHDLIKTSLAYFCFVFLATLFTHLMHSPMGTIVWMERVWILLPSPCEMKAERFSPFSGSFSLGMMNDWMDWIAT